MRRWSNYPKKIQRKLRWQCNHLIRVKASYSNIKAYAKEKYGVNVHTSYIAQVKRTCGLDMLIFPKLIRWEAYILEKRCFNVY